MSDTDGIRAAEAEEPGFVHRHGWTHLECPSCQDVIYDGRRIGPEDTAELIRIHQTSCAGGTNS